MLLSILVKYTCLSSELEKSEALQKEDKERAELEEILRETHGGNIYHWFQNED